MQLGVYQTDFAGLTPAARIDKLETTLEKNNLNLVVCPELFLSGYDAGNQLHEYAESQNGPLIKRLSGIANNTNTAIIAGYSEKHEGELYNSAICLDETGEVIANHRKLLLPPGFEDQYFSPGETMTLFKLGELNFAILICYDVEYPETVRAAAEQGAQVVVVPTALAKNWGVVANNLIPTRAFENGVWLAYANHAGIENDIEYYGGSCIAAPNGTDKARAGSTAELIIAEIDIESVEKAQARLPYLQGVKKMRQKIASA